MTLLTSLVLLRARLQPCRKSSLRIAASAAEGILTAALFLALAAPTLNAQTDAPNPLAPRVLEVLKRSANGHSPEPDEIASANGNAGQQDIQQAIPMLMLALDSTDKAVRTYALTGLNGLQTAPPVEAGMPPPPDSASVYKPEVMALVLPSASKIAAHLTEESTPNRLLTGLILGGFTPNTPASVLNPLLAYLKRDDATGPVGFLVFTDLLKLGPISDDTAAALIRFLRRSDLSADTRVNLADAIPGAPNQNAALNKALLGYLTSDNASLRARIILSLPQMDLTPEQFADSKTRVSQLVDNPNESLEVRNAAKAVATCWTATKMTSGCPVY